MSFLNNNSHKEQINANDWLTRAQAKQAIRIQNSLPPLKAEAKPPKKTLREKWNLKHGRSETGWTFNEETQLWEPPKTLKK